MIKKPQNLARFKGVAHEVPFSEMERDRPRTVTDEHSGRSLTSK